MLLDNLKTIWNVKIIWTESEKQNIISHVLKPEIVNTCSTAPQPHVWVVTNKSFLGQYRFLTSSREGLFVVPIVVSLPICSATGMACSHGLHWVSSIFPQFFFLFFWQCCLPSSFSTAVGTKNWPHLVVQMEQDGIQWAPWGLKEIMPGTQPHGRSWAHFPESIKRKNTIVFQNINHYQKVSNRDRIPFPCKKCTLALQAYEHILGRLQNERCGKINEYYTINLHQFLREIIQLNISAFSNQFFFNCISFWTVNHLKEQPLNLSWSYVRWGNFSLGNNIS